MISHEERLDDVDPALAGVVRAVACDVLVLCGHRGEKEQTEAFERGTSRLKWPKSKHNQKPSKAVDLAPVPINWNDTKRFYFLAGHMFQAAKTLGVTLRWGGDFKSFKDCPHFEVA